ncbi:histidine kinase [Haloglomus irregulare]|jgi:signal transduction histidine kinase|uniref:histidine kinase n=1 Tax=Haloglomus irregulare TaxID=2234134 RepID=A0A554N9I9_9EURY|nr:HAMP domain-containing sensor histidine kinase [Haloglomus irregulare]TSD14041.1 histidine kinase [Haloglomus irregulare]
MRGRLNYSGLIIAVVGFVLTRFTVSLVLYDDPIRFYFAGVVPLLLGLGLAAFGVALVVADVDPLLVRQTARWCLVGTGAMLVLVLLTIVGSTGGRLPTVETVQSELELSNFLIGGSIGGTLTGLYAARTRRQRRDVQQLANRLEALNRMLRHEILNAVTVIQGQASLSDEQHDGDSGIIRKYSDAIADTVDEVTYLTRSAKRATGRETTDLGSSLRNSIETIEDRYPDATIAVDALPDELPVRANGRLERVFTHLLENAVSHTAAETPTVSVGVDVTASGVEISVHDTGPGLPEPQQTLLETGEITEFDDPNDGYGLNVVRLLVESFGGTIETDVTDDGTSIAVRLARGEPNSSGIESSRTRLTGLTLDGSRLAVTLGASVLAGVGYGSVAEWLGGSVAAIGVFYGIANPVVGWLTHQFHSAVFAFVFAGFVSFAPERYRNDVPAHLAIGVGWALALWVGAAGVIAPVWLRLLGQQVSIPNLSVVLLWSHLVWGASLGVLTALGHRYVTPWLTRVTGREAMVETDDRPSSS